MSSININFSSDEDGYKLSFLKFDDESYFNRLNTVLENADISIELGKIDIDSTYQHISDNDLSELTAVEISVLLKSLVNQLIRFNNNNYIFIESVYIFRRFEEFTIIPIPSKKKSTLLSTFHRIIPEILSSSKSGFASLESYSQDFNMLETILFTLTFSKIVSTTGAFPKNNFSYSKTISFIDEELLKFIYNIFIESEKNNVGMFYIISSDPNEVIDALEFFNATIENRCYFRDLPSKLDDIISERCAFYTTKSAYHHLQEAIVFGKSIIIVDDTVINNNENVTLEYGNIIQRSFLCKTYDEHDLLNIALETFHRDDDQTSQIVHNILCANGNIYSDIRLSYCLLIDKYSSWDETRNRFIFNTDAGLYSSANRYFSKFPAAKILLRILAVSMVPLSRETLLDLSDYPKNLFEKHINLLINNKLISVQQKENEHLYTIRNQSLQKALISEFHSDEKNLLHKAISKNLDKNTCWHLYHLSFFIKNENQHTNTINLFLDLNINKELITIISEIYNNIYTSAYFQRAYTDLKIKFFKKSTKIFEILNDLSSLSDIENKLHKLGANKYEFADIVVSRIEIYKRSHDYNQVINIGLQYLSYFGVNPNRTPKLAHIFFEYIRTRMVAFITRTNFSDLKELDDVEYQSMGKVFSAMIGATYMAEPRLLPIFSCISVRQAIRRKGITQEHSIGFAGYAYANIEIGKKLPIFGNKLNRADHIVRYARNVDTTNCTIYENRLNLIESGIINNWRQDHRHSIQKLNEAYKFANERNDIEWALYTIAICQVLKLSRGIPLSKIKRSNLVPILQAKREGQTTTIANLEFVDSFCDSISNNKASIDLWDSQDWQRHVNVKDNTNVSVFLILKSCYLFISKRYDLALNICEEATPFLEGLQGQQLIVLHNFIYALSLYIQMKHENSTFQKYKKKLILSQKIKYFERLSIDSPVNFGHFYNFLNAITRISHTNDLEQAEKAIKSSEDQEYYHIAAMQSEVLSAIYKDLHFNEKSVKLQEVAIRNYKNWNANWKSSDLINEINATKSNDNNHNNSNNFDSKLLELLSNSILTDNTHADVLISNILKLLTNLDYIDSVSIYNHLNDDNIISLQLFNGSDVDYSVIDLNDPDLIDFHSLSISDAPIFSAEENAFIKACLVETSDIKRTIKINLRDSFNVNSTEINSYIITLRLISETSAYKQQNLDVIRRHDEYKTNWLRDKDNQQKYQRLIELSGQNFIEYINNQRSLIQVVSKQQQTPLSAAYLNMMEQFSKQQTNRIYNSICDPESLIQLSSISVLIITFDRFFESDFEQNLIRAFHINMDFIKPSRIQLDAINFEKYSLVLFDLEHVNNDAVHMRNSKIAYIDKINRCDITARHNISFDKERLSLFDIFKHLDKNNKTPINTLKAVN